MTGEAVPKEQTAAVEAVESKSPTTNEFSSSSAEKL